MGDHRSHRRTSASATCSRATPCSTKIIEWSGRNPFLVLLATLFIVIGGVVAVLKTPLDALPDLSDVQVIVYTEYPGQAPQVVEDQVTYPLTTAMLAVPKSKVVRGFSFFGASFVYVIFEDGTDIYWARTRVLEYLNFASGRLPKGVTPTLGPDATGVGWVYQYVLLAKDKTLAELRTHPGLVRALPADQGAGRGRSGVDRRLRADLPGHRRSGEAAQPTASRWPRCRRSSAIPTATSAAAWSRWPRPNTWCAARATCAARPTSRMLVVKSDGGTPVLIRDIARVELAPDERRGLAELNGEGEVVSGIAMARYGQNALEVIGNLKAKVAEISGGLPQGVTIEAVYDRSELIHRAIDTLKRTLIEESLIVAAGLRGLPAACAHGAGGHPDAAGRRADRLHRHAPAGHELQPDEPGRHRHRHRRDGGRGHRDDRERAQAPRAADSPITR